MTPIEVRSLELYFINGRPDGMLKASVPNWSGHVLMTPRTQIAAALTRDEAKHPGVYILLGEQDGKQCASIGEGDDISERIKNHETTKDWWTIAVLVTAAKNDLDKARVKYLEARLVDEAKLVGRITLLNGNNPHRPRLPEAATANMDLFLGYLFTVLPALQIDMFINNTRPRVQTAGKPLPRFTLTNQKHDLNATAVLQDSDFIVEAGSRARLRWEGKGTEIHDAFHGYAALYEELRKIKVLKKQGDHCVFKDDYAFKSPSAAASVINGLPTSGPIVWKVEGNSSLTYRDWESGQLAKMKQGAS